MNIVEREQKYNNLIENILYFNGVKDIRKFLYPTDEDNTDVFELPNIHEGIRLIAYNINKKILLLIDSDADGITSSAMIYKYLKHVRPDVDLEYFLHSKKAHGFTDEFMEAVDRIKPQLIIVPDAGTNDIEQREKIINDGIDLIIIDHHNEEFTTDKGGVLINNHSNFPKNNINKNLTGATMTYLFLKAADKSAFSNSGYFKELDDIAMIGTVGDCASLIDNEVRYLCLNAIKNIKCNFLKEVVNYNKQNLYDLNLIDLQFRGIISLLNSVIRIGDAQEKEIIFKALVDLDTDKTFTIEKNTYNKYTNRYELETISCNIYQYAIEVAKICKTRQDKIVKQELERAMSFYNDKQGVQIYILTNPDAKALTGLIAGQLSGKWEQPVIVVHKVGENYIGSLRGNTKAMKNFKEWCESTGLFKMVQGHNNAAGVIFSVDKYDEILKACETVENAQVYYVEKLYNGRVDINDIYLIDNNKNIFKNGISTPLFGIKQIRVNECNFMWSKNTLRIKHGNVTYIKFQTSEQDMLKLKECNFLDLVGNFQINIWNNNKYSQVVVNDIEGY